MPMGGGSSGGGVTATDGADVSLDASTLQFPAGTVTDEGGGVALYDPQFPLSERVLSRDFTIPDNYSSVVVGPLAMNGHDITFGANSALAVLEGNP